MFLIEIRRLFGQNMPDQFRHFSRRRDLGDVVSFFPKNSFIERGKRRRRPDQSFGGFTEKPAGFGATLFGNSSVKRL